ncbi:zinc finger protein on ecdysone puffs [Anabrus simplex]|uniref:zinc finger protein on ecdysone puffs n=1 Tax=Anabrus simplex TaxID=316456 RepID=UPI0035A32214
MSYNSYYKGAPRGRGFGSRGSFRGRGGDSGSRGRGSSRGRFGWYKERISGFESRNRYLSGGGGGGAVRYSGYRRFRGDDIDFLPRERFHRSPDMPRKRMRSEHAYLQISEDDDDDDDLIEGEIAVKKKVKKVKKEKTATKEEEPEEGEEVEEEGDEAEGNGGEEKKKKGEEKTNSEANNGKDQDSDAHSTTEEGQRKKPVYDLSCPHCLTQCDTVQEYKMHLYSSKHINAMRKQSLLHKQTLQRMRMNQRQKQRILEETEEIRPTLSARTKFCAICKLNYKQPKSTHMTSEDHEDMVKFLNPYCRVCKQRFNTPMFYEHHLCSLDHIKFKALLADKSKSDDEEGGGKDDEKELNLDNFMILDSVGSVDGEEGESGGDEKVEKKAGGEEEKKTKTKSKAKTENIGAEYARKVEVYYCDLCRTYLPWYDEQEKALAIHCRSRSHLQRYVRYREDRLLRKEAERLHQKKLAKRKAEKEARAKKASEKKDQSADKTAENKEKSEKDGEKSSEDTAGESPKKKKKKTEDGSEVSQGEGQAAEGAGQEQDQDLEMGTEEDLDKEIGGLLDEVEEAVNKSSDEDEDSRGRYDRFQNSEKGSTALNANQSEEDVTKVTTEEEQAAEVDDEDMEKPEDAKSEPQSPAKKASVPESASTPPTAASTD